MAVKTEKTAIHPFVSPLRYPGGKRKLANFIKVVFYSNNLLDCDYVEPYAGGASVALALLYDECARYVHINDLNPGVYAFWESVLSETESLCKLIRDSPINMDEWKRQRGILARPDASLLELGFATFYLNRTNRSGIISGGVIGGQKQAGQWTLDARFNKADLIGRVKKVARYRSRIRLYNIDAAIFIQRILPSISERALIYLDPPYYVKGQQELYTNSYSPNDHEAVAQKVRTIKQHWIVSYDDVPEVRQLYKRFRSLSYGLHYSAQARYKGAEVMFFGDSLEVPEVTDPSKIRSRALQGYLF